MAKSSPSRMKAKAAKRVVAAKPSRAKSSRTSKKARVTYKDDTTDKSSDDDAGDDDDDAYEDEDEEEEEEVVSEEIDSDDLDDSDGGGGSARKRKKATGAKKAKTTSKSSSPVKDGSTKAIKLVNGPGRDEYVEAGLVAPFTMKFLADLAKPENNEREWLALHDARYRASLANWHEFVNAVVPKFVEADWTIPTLPSKDLVHRIYRDIRFSQDKTPYKTNFSAGISRTGRKGPWASYYLQIKPGGHSLLAGGKWMPEKNDLATIRHSILHHPNRIRKVIRDPAFVKTFGPPKEGEGKKKRQNIFGHDDALKNCPKMDGVTKDHPDIDLLKLRTVAAVKYFPDEVVLSDRFMDEIGKVAKALAPLVQLLNDMILPQSDDEEDEDDDREAHGGAETNGDGDDDDEDED